MSVRKLPTVRLALPGLALALGLVLHTAAPAGGGGAPGPQAATPPPPQAGHERPAVFPGAALQLGLLRRALVEKASVKLGIVTKPDLACTVLAVDEVSVLVQSASSLQLVMLSSVTAIELPAAFSDVSGLSAGLVSRTLAPAPARSR